MKKVFLFFSLLTVSVSFSQNNDTIGEAARKLRQRDSVIQHYQHKRDSLNELIHNADTALIKQEFRSNTDYFLRLQKENRAKQKKAAMTRIAIGLAGFAILIIGLMRRKKAMKK